MNIRKINFLDVNKMLAQVGGFWSSIAGLGFLLLNFFLYQSFMTTQARTILSQQSCQHGEEKE